MTMIRLRASEVPQLCDAVAAMAGYPEQGPPLRVAVSHSLAVSSALWRGPELRAELAKEGVPPPAPRFCRQALSRSEQLGTRLPVFRLRDVPMQPQSGSFQASA